MRTSPRRWCRLRELRLRLANSVGHPQSQEDLHSLEHRYYPRIIDRWWDSMTAVLMNAFLDDATQHLTPPDLGTLAADLCSHLRHCALFFASSDAGAVFRALIGEAQHDPALAAELRAKYLSQQRTRDRMPFLRAIERGELPPDLDLDLVIDQLIAPIHHRVLVSGEPVTQSYTDGLVTRVLTQFTSAGEV